MRGTAVASETMPKDPTRTIRFRLQLASRPAEAWGLHPKTYQRYLRGEVPEQWDVLLEHVDLLVALLGDAFRLEEDAYREGVSEEMRAAIEGRE